MSRNVEISDATYRRILKLMGPEDTTGAFIAKLLDRIDEGSASNRTSAPDMAPAIVMSPEKSAVHPPRKKGRRTKLKVRVGNRTVFRDSAAATFVDAVFAAGVEKVEELQLKLCGEPLVSRSEPTNPERGHQFKNGWYVMTHSSTREKKGILGQIAEDLGLDWTIEIV